MKGFGDFKRIAVVCIPKEEELKRRLDDKKEKGNAYSIKESTLNSLQGKYIKMRCKTPKDLKKLF